MAIFPLELVTPERYPVFGKTSQFVRAPGVKALSAFARATRPC